MMKLYIFLLIYFIACWGHSSEKVELKLKKIIVNGLDSKWGSCALLEHRRINRFTDGKEIAHQLLNQKINQEELLQLTKVNASVNLLKSELRDSTVDVTLNYLLPDDTKVWIENNEFNNLDVDFSGHGLIWSSPIYLFSDKFKFTLFEPNNLQLTYSLPIRQYCDFFKKPTTLSVNLNIKGE